MSRRGFLAVGALLPAVLLRPVRASAQDAPTEADVGFCRDMSAHHAQALVMCQRVLGRDTGSTIQAAAVEVLQAQAIEIGHMQAWLADWGASTVPPSVVMGWMGAGDGAGVPLAAMPGYATAAELLELSTLDGRARGRRWLELMRAHHVGGVTMAGRAAELASAVKVIRIARGQVAAQTYEIAQYDRLLAGEYAEA
ncbi:MAG: DUF305 domain-containing protein [Sandaracinaceae bacterium]